MAHYDVAVNCGGSGGDGGEETGSGMSSPMSKLSGKEGNNSSSTSIMVSLFSRPVPLVPASVLMCRLYQSDNLVINLLD